MSGHAILSPSSAHRWMACPGSVALCASLPEESRLESATDVTFEGTVAHAIAADCLEAGLPASTFVGHQMAAPDGTVFTADATLCEDVQTYVDYVTGRFEALQAEWEKAGRPGAPPSLLIEHEVDISGLTGEEGATGTSDAVLIGVNSVEIIDLKFGRGVRVDAEDNWQLRIYGIPIVRAWQLVQDIDRLTTTIHQPRLGHVSTVTYTEDDLLPFELAIGAGASSTRATGAPLIATENGCKFCRAKPTCPELREVVLDTVWPQGDGSVDDFEDTTQAANSMVASLEGSDEAWLSYCMQRVGLVESWCKAVRAEVERRMLAGTPVEGFKLVRGKKGIRKWDNPEAVEALLKGWRIKLEDMYDLKLISPTTAEKLHKLGTIGPRRWPNILEHITQSDGTLSVAPLTDPRPAAASVSDSSGDFDDLTQE